MSAVGWGASWRRQPGGWALKTGKRQIEGGTLGKGVLGGGRGQKASPALLAAPVPVPRVLGLGAQSLPLSSVATPALADQ